MSPRLAFAASGLVALAACGAAWHYAQRARESDQRATTVARENADLRFELKQTRERADNLAAKLAAADTQLGSAKTRATATETRSAQLARELSTVRATLSEREQREVALMAELENLRQQAKSPPTPVVPPPIDLAPYQRRIAELETQLLDLLTRALADLGPSPDIPEPATPARRESPPQVVEVGAGGAFVVIDRGTQHGLRSGDVCAFTRDGTELALGRLSEVRPRFSIVQLLPGASKGQLQAGDIAVLAN